MIDHFNLPVSDIAKAQTFYDAVLNCLGKMRIAKDRDAVGYGKDTWEFGLVPADGDCPSMHLAFSARSRSDVDDFHAAGLLNGGKDHGAPGARPEYGEGYYACYLFDPDGHNIEAVYRG